VGFVADHGQFDRACEWCPDPSDCDLAGYCQLGDETDPPDSFGHDDDDVYADDQGVGPA
jgi:hypothetical protein